MLRQGLHVLFHIVMAKFPIPENCSAYVPMTLKEFCSSKLNGLVRKSWFRGVSPKVHQSEGPPARRSTSPKVRQSEGPFVLMVATHTFELRSELQRLWYSRETEDASFEFWWLKKGNFPKCLVQTCILKQCYQKLRYKTTNYRNCRK